MDFGLNISEDGEKLLLFLRVILIFWYLNNLTVILIPEDEYASKKQ